MTENRTESTTVNTAEGAAGTVTESTTANTAESAAGTVTESTTVNTAESTAGTVTGSTTVNTAESEAGDSKQSSDIDSIIAALDTMCESGVSRIKMNVNEEVSAGEIKKVSHHGRCDAGSPSATGSIRNFGNDILDTLDAGCG